MKVYDTIIVGGGAAAYAAAIYAARYNMKTLLIQKDFGGETALAGMIGNYPGVPGLEMDGYELMKNMKEQANALGVEFVDGQAKLAENIRHCMKVTVDGEEYNGKTIILAVGMEHRKLGIEKEDTLKGKGVHYCTTCDGPLYKGKKVGIIGGGDSAVKSGNQILDMGASHVYMIVREKDLSRAEPINLEKLKKKGDKVSYLFENEITSLLGKDKVEGVTIKEQFEEKNEIELDGIFIHIGAEPRDELPKMLDVEFDEHSQVNVDPNTMETNIDGVFACGDVTNASGRFKQIVTAASQGSIAATSAYHDTQEHPNVCELHALPTKDK